MAIDRREVLRALAAGGLLAALPAAWAATPTRYLAARRRAGRHEVALIDAEGRDLRVIDLPDRGHSFAIDTTHGRAVVFGRQPGFFALGFDLAGDAPPQALPLAGHRHYYGHGAFSADGQRLYATEQDYDTGRGLLGVYARDGDGPWRRTDEFDTGGIGPHEVILMPDGRSLCVANGGILTHPDYGKTELNLDSMSPSLAYLDAADGRLLEQVALDPALYRLSIRHLALDRHGAVWFGCQYMGAQTDVVPLVGRHRRGAAPQLFTGDPGILRDMRHYVGSMATDADGAIVAASSPLGGLTTYWDARDGRSLGATSLADGCGVAAREGGGFVLSSGHGALLAATPGHPTSVIHAADDSLGWDNHLRRL